MFYNYNARLKTILSIIYKNTIDSFTDVIILGADVKNWKEVKFKLALNLTSFKAGTSCTPKFVKVMSIYLRLFSHMKSYCNTDS